MARVDPAASHVGNYEIFGNKPGMPVKRYFMPHIAGFSFLGPDAMLTSFGHLGIEVSAACEVCIDAWCAGKQSRDFVFLRFKI